MGVAVSTESRDFRVFLGVGLASHGIHWGEDVTPSLSYLPLSQEVSDQAAITNCRGMGRAYRQLKFTSRSWGVRDRVVARLGSGEGPLPGSQMSVVTTPSASCGVFNLTPNVWVSSESKPVSWSPYQFSDIPKVQQFRSVLPRSHRFRARFPKTTPIADASLGPGPPSD